MGGKEYLNSNQPEAKAIGEILPKIAETLTLVNQSQTTQKPQSSASECRQQKERLEMARFKWSAKWLKMDHHHPQLHDLEEQVYSFVQDVYHQRKSGRGLIIYGPNGCGKSHAARAIKAWFDTVRIKIGPVAIQTDEGEDARLAECCYRMWPAVVKGFKQDQFLIVDYLMNEYLTIIDDIGAEHDPSRFGVEELYLILSRREFRYTVITTNIPPAEWESKFERRISSRLYRNMTHIDLTEVPDYRAIVEPGNQMPDREFKKAINVRLPYPTD